MSNPAQIHAQIGEAIRESCADISGSVYVAYSGGMDSTVLLHLAKEALESSALQAVHVEHGLHPDASDWASHCEATAKRLNVALQVLKIDANAPPGQSPEAYARKLRYEAMAGLLAADDVLLTAHHRDDNDETLMLHLMRGAGPAGLAGIPASRALGAGQLRRPLLACTRAQLTSIAKELALEWREDPSNADTALRRNHLRHEVMPGLARYGTGYAGAFSRVRQLQADAAANLKALADIDLKAAEALTSSPIRLSTKQLRKLPEERRRNALYHWLASLEIAASWQVLEALDQLVLAKPDAHGGIPCESKRIYQYQDQLYLEPELQADTEARLWQSEATLTLPQGELLAVLSAGRGIRLGVARENELHLDFRKDGERIKLGGRNNTHALSKLFQEARIPPWRRTMLPMIFHGDKLIAVPGIGIAEEYAVDPGEAGLVPVFQFTADRVT